MKYVNSHIHSPYSFSPFDSIEQAVRFALEVNVTVLGINDYNTVEGYEEFYNECVRFHIYPLFGVEFLTVLPQDRVEGFRWNDQIHPGIMHICGKGLSYPVNFPIDVRNSLAAVWKSSQDRIWLMILNVNDILKKNNFDITLDYNVIRKNFARSIVGERHIAKTLYFEFVKRWNTSDELLAAFQRLFGDNAWVTDVADSVALQNEIGKKLLWPGGAAYVEERDSAFLRESEARSLILKAGGIPSYLMLLDEEAGLTEYESSCQKLYEELSSRGFFAVEFITSRVSFETLKRYALYFKRNGFIVTFGTDHNTVEQNSLIPSTRGDRPFDDELMQIGYQGACIIAAHQEFSRRGLPGFVNDNGERLIAKPMMQDFIRTGEEIIRKQTTL
ncbi:MAG: PHP domain-containing protein [Chitinispirillaceae bacterium]|nr:PHP domain-containing protein [Chitinispirillaceae bacterium]